MTDTNICYLYSLIDPITKIVRYIGTSRNPKERFGAHLNEKSNMKKVSWIQSLKQQELKPILKCLRSGSREEMQKKEERLIRYLFKKKHPLLNIKKGCRNTTNAQASRFKLFSIRLPKEYKQTIKDRSQRDRESQGYILQQCIYNLFGDALPPPRRTDKRKDKK